MEIITKSQARERGLNKYFTGKPCKNGHVDQRHMHNSVCMGCIRVASRNWYKKRRDHKREKSKQVYLANRTNVMARTNAYRIKHKDKYQVWVKSWAKNNPEKMYEFSKNWRKKNSHRVATWNRNNQAKRKLAVGTHSIEDILLRLKWQHGMCAACRVDISKKYHVDHYQPLARGGSNYPSNLQLLCQPCNNRKHAKDPIDFYRSLGFLL